MARRAWGAFGGHTTAMRKASLWSVCVGGLNVKLAGRRRCNWAAFVVVVAVVGI